EIGVSAELRVYRGMHVYRQRVFTFATHKAIGDGVQKWDKYSLVPHLNCAVDGSVYLCIGPSIVRRITLPPLQFCQEFGLCTDIQRLHYAPTKLPMTLPLPALCVYVLRTLVRPVIPKM